MSKGGNMKTFIKFPIVVSIFFLCFLFLTSSIYGQECSCPDSDSDGVPDAWDNCASTPSGAYVDKNGCPAIGFYSEEQMNKMVQNILTWGDIDGDKKIGLSEVIHALRVVAGITEPSIINGTVLFYDNFDTATVGGLPSGWGAPLGNNGDGQCVVTSSQSYSSPNSFRIGCQSNWDGVYSHPVTMTGNIVVASLRFKGDPNTWFRPYFDITVANKSYGGSYDPNYEKIYWSCNSPASSSISKNIWYTVQIRVNKTTGLASYYLNGNLVGSNCQGNDPFYGRENENITLASGNGGAGIIYYDDISVIGY
jgi:hypothetical protein